jgi:adenosylhomocysteine nucleosidase
MILIFYAFRRELSDFRKRIANRAALPAGLRGFKGRIGDHDIFLVATGIGVAQARESARRALRMLGRPRLVISTGVAGALAPDLKAGNIVIANPLLLEESRDSGCVEVARLSPGIEQTVRDTLGRTGLTVATTGPLLTAGWLLEGADAKHAAFGRTGAIAVDMESAALATEVTGAGIPFLCLRAVMDEADDEIPGAELPDATGHIPPLKAAAYFIMNPAALAAIPATIRKLNRATAAIAVALEVLCIEPRVLI